jgi:putative FmdB family regulatory protein
MYEYVHDADDRGDCAVRFEVLQAMAEEPLTACPRCGAACHRVFSTFGVVGKEKAMLSDKNLAAQGFTKYVKQGDGTYEKTAGEGPDLVHRD